MCIDWVVTLLIKFGAQDRVMRYPWQEPTPEEDTLPVSASTIPSKVKTDWVKGMMKRAFGKDTFAKTLLQNGCSDKVLAEYKRQNDMEHNTQEAIGTLEQYPSLAQRRDNFKKYELQLADNIKSLQQRLRETQDGLHN